MSSVRGFSVRFRSRKFCLRRNVCPRPQFSSSVIVMRGDFFEDVGATGTFFSSLSHPFQDLSGDEDERQHEALYDAQVILPLVSDYFLPCECIRTEEPRSSSSPWSSILVVVNTLSTNSQKRLSPSRTLKGISTDFSSPTVPRYGPAR